MHQDRLPSRPHPTPEGRGVSPLGEAAFPAPEGRVSPIGETQRPLGTAIIQASMAEPMPAGPLSNSAGLPRSGSRLTGRMQRLLAGRPVLQHIIDRLCAAETVGRVVVALSVAPEDDVLLPLIRGTSAQVFRGSVHDQVGRLTACAEWLGLGDDEAVVRVLGDAPLIDPRYVDAGVTALRARGAPAVEFQEDQAEELCTGVGAGFLTVRTLKLLDRRARSAVHRADAMSYIFEHPQEIGLQRVALPEPLLYLRGAHRLLLQTAEDLALHEAIYIRLYNGAPIDTADAIAFLDADPVLASLNRGVLRRGLTLPLQGQVGWRAR